MTTRQHYLVTLTPMKKSTIEEIAKREGDVIAFSEGGRSAVTGDYPSGDSGLSSREIDGYFRRIVRK